MTKFSLVSKGEEKIAAILSRHGIDFQREVSFKDLKNKQHLRFDFALYSPQKELICLLEVDGEQHFKCIKLFGGEDGYRMRKYLDKRKNNYCLSHNITLIRIPYWELEKLTYEKIFTTPDFLVKTQYHNDLLIESRKL